MKPPNSSAKDGDGAGDEYRRIKTQWANAQLLAEEEARNAARATAAAAAAAQQKLGRKTKPGAASEEDLVKAVKERDVQRNKAKEREFKVMHGGVLGLLGWFM